jgi:hypothetical protein
MKKNCSKFDFLSAAFCWMMLIDWVGNLIETEHKEEKSSKLLP